MGIRQSIRAVRQARKPPEPDSLDAIQGVRRLQQMVRQVSSDEFRWQDAHYGQDSYYGRELLFLIANNEWTRATQETVDITRSDSVDTQVKVEVDLEQVTHEAFRSRPRKLWLPLLILSGPKRGSPDVDSGTLSSVSAGSGAAGDKPAPFASLTVTDAADQLLALLPSTDVWHRISAAMAEIIINLAVASWSGADSERPTSTRDQRLLLSAAIYRLLQARNEDPSGASPGGSSRRDEQEWPGDGKMAGRIGAAKGRLDRLLAHYLRDPAGHSFLLPRRAIEVLDGFAEAIVVVVAVSSAVTPTVFTVHAPTRRLYEGRRPIVGWPRASLLIDLLLPSADADRMIQVNLPDGVSFDNSRNPSPRGGMTIEVCRPRPLEHLQSLMRDLTDHDGRAPRPGSVRRCLADLAMVKAEASIEALRHHLVGSTGDPDSDADMRRTRVVQEKLARLHRELGEFEADHEGAPGRLAGVWNAGKWLPETLWRPVLLDTLSPRAAVAWTAGIEDVSHRARPVSARIKVNVAVADAEFFSVARFAGMMSMLLTAVVLVFFAVAAVRHHDENLESPSPEVLAATLTLFSVILAGRLRHPDTSTLRGLLSSTGNWLIVFSVMPTVILAIALAFHVSGWAAVFWAVGAIGIQLSLELVMYRGALSDTGSRRRRLPGRKLSTWPEPAYEQSEILHTRWWRSTTAEALMIGTEAHAYVVWEHSKTPGLYDLLLDARVMPPRPAVDARQVGLDAPPSGAVLAPGPVKATARSPKERPRLAAADAAEAPDGAARWANILALLRSGTTKQALTFIIFREQPVQEWAARVKAEAVTLDPDRLAPLEASADDIDILIGLPPYEQAPLLAGHPLTKVLEVASAHQFIVLDAQHPVPTPSAARVDWRWSRIRVGLRDADVPRLADFLAAIYHLAAVHPWDLRVQMTAARSSQPLSPAAPGGRGSTAGRLVLDSDMDAVTKASGSEHNHRGSRWRMMAICADARVGIEHDLIQELATADPHLRLAGINYATMHGMAVILLLGCQGQSHPVADRHVLLTELSKAGTNVAIPVDQWQSCGKLGHASRYPLLRVRLRNQDRPGAIVDLLHSLGAHLRRGFPSMSGQIGTWYAQSEITSGHAAFTRISAPLPINYDSARNWPEAKVQELRKILEQIENDVRHETIRIAAARSPVDTFAAEPDLADEPVISVNFIEAPGEPA